MADGSMYVGEVNLGETPHGFGKIFYPNGKRKLMFEGQFFRGQKHGNGKLFYTNGALGYEVLTKLSLLFYYFNILTDKMNWGQN